MENPGSETIGAAAICEETGMPGRPCRRDAERAVELLIRWAGDDPRRPGLAETPARVVRAYEEWFSGYAEDPGETLAVTFDEIGGYGEAVELRDIAFDSWCEHHMAPIRGHAHVAYVPAGKVVGISKLARTVGTFARRLQIQERLTDQIASAIHDALDPAGVAVVIEAEHGCMSSRGVRACGSRLVTRSMRGSYVENVDLRQEFLASLNLL